MSIYTKNKIWKFLGLHGLVSCFTSILTLSTIGSGAWQNFMLGQFYLWFSLLTLSLTIHMFFLKKNVALLVGVIVFKWPILMYMVYKMTSTVSLQPIWLATGLMTILVSALLWSFLQTE